jgi:glutamate-1-semialdehyde 2,1-aminomutase
MYQAGTLSGNPLAVAAGVAALTELKKPGVYQQLETMGQRLADGLTKVFDQAEIPGTVNRIGSMLTGFFSAGPVESLDQVEQADTAAYGRYFHAMLERGVYLAPSQFEAGFVSLAHTDADIDQTITVAKEALASLG